MPYPYHSIYFDSNICDGRVLDVLPPGADARNLAIFLIHGSGWRGGAWRDFHRIARALNGRGYWCGATDYRLDVTIRDQITDVRHGYMLFVDALRAAGRAPNRMFRGCSSCRASEYDSARRVSRAANIWRRHA